MPTFRSDRPRTGARTPRRRSLTVAVLVSIGSNPERCAHRWTPSDSSPASTVSIGSNPERCAHRKPETTQPARPDVSIGSNPERCAHRAVAFSFSMAMPFQSGPTRNGARTTQSIKDLNDAVRFQSGPTRNGARTFLASAMPAVSSPVSIGSNPERCAHRPNIAASIAAKRLFQSGPTRNGARTRWTRSHAPSTWSFNRVQPGTVRAPCGREGLDGLRRYRFQSGPTRNGARTCPPRNPLTEHIF
jgi:hypothetical protein